MANGKVTLREVYASQKATHEVVSKLDTKFDNLSVEQAKHCIQIQNNTKGIDNLSNKAWAIILLFAGSVITGMVNLWSVFNGK